MMPENPDEQARIQRLLESDVRLRDSVQRICSCSIDLFPNAQLGLNTQWDPPLSLFITVPYSDQRQFSKRDGQFISWLTNRSGYDPDRLFVMVLPHTIDSVSPDDYGARFPHCC